MFSRGLACSLVLGMASIAFAGATVTLVPQTSAPYAPDSIVKVDVMLQQTPAGSDIQLRHVQLDFSASDAAPGQLQLIGPITHSGSNVRFWNFTEAGGNCTAGTEATCGAGHFLDSQFTLPTGREKVVSMTYYFTDPNVLTVNANAQRMLPASASIKIGEIDVRMPNNATPACYTLDALTATQTNPDLGGAEIRFGFGTDVGGIPLTTWRVGNPAATGIAGASIEMGVNQTCGIPPVCTADLTASAPNDQGSLWRSERNIIRLTFDSALPGLPPAGAVKIRKMVATPACGSYEADLSAGFTFALESGNTVLRIRETATTGGPLEHRSWYEVSAADGAWAGVCAFKRQFVVQVGDADANRFVTAIDVGAINASPGGAVPDNSRVDIDGNGFRTAIDVGIANASQGGLPAKPCGH